MRELDWNAFGLPPVAWVAAGIVLYLVGFALSRLARRTRRWPRLLRAAIILAALGTLAVAAWHEPPEMEALGFTVKTWRLGAEAWLVAPGRGAELGFLALWLVAGMVLAPWVVGMVWPRSAFARLTRSTVAYTSFVGLLVLLVLFETPLRQLVNRVVTDGAKVELPGGVRFEMIAAAARTAQAPFTLRAGEGDQAGAALATATYELSRLTMHAPDAWPNDPFSHLSLVERDFRIMMISSLATGAKERLRQRAQSDLRFLLGMTPVFSCLHGYSGENGDPALLLPLLAPLLNNAVALLEDPGRGTVARPPPRIWVGRASPELRLLADADMPRPISDDIARPSPARRLETLQHMGRQLVTQVNLLLREAGRDGQGDDFAGQTHCSHEVSVAEILKEDELHELGATPYPAIALAHLYAAIGSPQSGMAVLERWIARQPALPPARQNLANMWWPIRARIERAVIADRITGSQALTGEARAVLLRDLTQEMSKRFDSRRGGDVKDASDALCEVIMANPGLDNRRARQSVAFTHALFRSRAFALLTPDADLAELPAWLRQAREIVGDARGGCFDGLRRFDEEREGWLGLLELDRLWLESIDHFRADAPARDAQERAARSARLLAEARLTEQRLATFIRASANAARPLAPTVNWCVHLDRASRLGGAIQLALADRSAAGAAVAGMAPLREVRERCLGGAALSNAAVRD